MNIISTSKQYNMDQINYPIKFYERNTPINEQADLYILHPSEIQLAAKLRKTYPKSLLAFYDTEKYNINTLLKLNICGIINSADDLPIVLAFAADRLSSRYITIQRNSEITKIKISSIYYVDIENRNIAYHCNNKTYYSNVLQKSFAKNTIELQKHSKFIFLEPAILINLSYIDTIAADHVKFDNGMIKYFPKTKYQKVKEAFNNFYNLGNSN